MLHRPNYHELAERACGSDLYELPKFQSGLSNFPQGVGVDNYMWRTYFWNLPVGQASFNLTCVLAPKSTLASSQPVYPPYSLCTG